MENKLTEKDIIAITISSLRPWFRAKDVFPGITSPSLTIEYLLNYPK